MEYHNIAKDKRNRSLMSYGTLGFPFSCFWDDVKLYRNGVIDWHWHDELELVYVLENSVLCCAGGEQKELSAGEGMFINRNVIHRFQTRTEGKIMSLVFSPHFLAAPSSRLFTSYVEPVLRSAVYACAFSPETAWQAEALEKLRELVRVIRQGGELQEIDLYILLLQFWRDFYANGVEREPKAAPDFVRTQERVRKMLEYVEQNYQKEISTADIAGAAHISSSEARRCFQRLMYRSPGKYLNEYRLSRAEELLRTTDIPISYIADQVGFRSAAYFDRMFVRQYGITPRGMRTSR